MTRNKILAGFCFAAAGEIRGEDAESFEHQF